ncbi:MAG: dihydropteroate synthase [Deltaproteobacteria bacterium]|nr:dihydropteroate synthase [Deltaproteobacteria bacterium]
MLIVGERINTSRKKVDEAVGARDAAYIQNDVKAQVAAGAHYIDVNAGSRLGSELSDVLWLIEIVQEAADVPLAVDSPSPEVLMKAMERVRHRPMINSTTAEKERFEKMRPVISSRECDIVALCMDDRGMPRDAAQVLENARRLVADLEAMGIARDRIYLDPLIQPISTDVRMGMVALEAIARIHEELPGVHTICGLSNISFGLPERHLINRNFLALAMGAGLSAAILDPLDDKLMTTLITTRALLGQDEYCMNYIRASREGKLIP